MEYRVLLICYIRSLEVYYMRALDEWNIFESFDSGLFTTHNLKHIHKNRGSHIRESED
jgi:hypothetical protein